jgi:choline dehydrogenase-like flavoprotein
MHISFATDAPTGFDGLREIYRSVQRRRLPRRDSLKLIAGNAGWLARAAWHRAVERRVLPPDAARYEAHLVVEQIPVAGNRIRLSDFERDLFGIALAEIEWHVSEQDVANAQRVLDAFTRCWSGTTLSQTGDLQLYPAERWTAALVSCGGIYHPGGTLRMSSSPRTGVVNGALRTYAVPNLTVLSTAAFPSGGSANPTLMLALFTMRAADELARSAA